MQVVVFNKAGGIQATVKPLPSSELIQSSAGEDYIRLNFDLSTFIEIPIGCFIVYAQTGARYTIQEIYRLETSPALHHYECTFKGEIHSFENCLCLLYTEKVSGGNYIDSVFALTGNAQTFLQFIVQNLNRNGLSITAGEAETTSHQTVNFNGWNCLQSIIEITNLFGISFYLENSILHFKKRNITTFVTLQVGILAGNKKITRFRNDTEGLYTRVRAYGAAKNLPARSGNGTIFDGETLNENRLSFIGINGESMVEQNIALYGIRETVKIFDEIAPSYTGTVTALGTSLQKFVDAHFSFLLTDYLLSGINPKISFLSGKLAGRSFGVSQISQTELVIDYYTDESGIYPNETLFVATGDTYTMFDIAFPEEYLVEAQTKLQTAAVNYLQKYSSPRCAYEAELDPVFLRGKNIHLHVWDIIRIVCPEQGLDDFYDIKELTVPCFTALFDYTIKFGEYLPKSLLTRLKDITFATDNKIGLLENNSVTNNNVTNIIGDSFEWKSF